LAAAHVILAASNSYSIRSIIIVGVGKDNFENMTILDGDERPYAARDIVQVCGAHATF
jgi:hypothetical protein